MADLVDKLGVASARIYAAFGSKENLFREAIALYQTHEGSFVERALVREPDLINAIRRMLYDGITLYTRRRGPRGCMVVTAATNCSLENNRIAHWLSGLRRARTALLVTRFKVAVRRGELRNCNPQSLADLCASVLHGVSVQARDGVPRLRLLAAIPPVIALLEAHRPQ